ncbi:MAG: hypothetical protein PW786_07005 [Arachidicoccus sp.]|nr:hypothetical protein [Arachidicoccus sp.]
MWVKLKHQPIKKGDLLIHEIDKEDLYNKDILSSFFVKEIEGENYQLENFIIQPDFNLDATPNIAIPIDFTISYKELVKANWHLWID